MDYNLEKVSQENELEIDSITEKNVVEAIKDFKENKAPGVDEMSSTYALKICDIIAKPLACLYNKSLKCNDIPGDWKKQ